MAFARGALRLALWVWGLSASDPLIIERFMLIYEWSIKGIGTYLPNARNVHSGRERGLTIQFLIGIRRNSDLASPVWPCRLEDPCARLPCLCRSVCSIQANSKRKYLLGEQVQMDLKKIIAGLQMEQEALERVIVILETAVLSRGKLQGSHECSRANRLTRSQQQELTAYLRRRRGKNNKAQAHTIH